MLAHVAAFALVVLLVGSICFQCGAGCPISSRNTGSRPEQARQDGDGIKLNTLCHARVLPFSHTCARSGSSVRTVCVQVVGRVNKGLDVLELLGDVPCGPDDSPLMRLKIAKCGPTNAEVGAERVCCGVQGGEYQWGGGWVGREEEAVVGRLHTPATRVRWRVIKAAASGATAAACAAHQLPKLPLLLFPTDACVCRRACMRALMSHTPKRQLRRQQLASSGSQQTHAALSCE